VFSFIALLIDINVKLATRRGRPSTVHLKLQDGRPGFKEIFLKEEQGLYV